MSRDPLRGHLFENAVLLELRKYKLNRGLDPNLFYYRDVQRNEIDVIYKRGHELIPIEIKSAQTYHSEFLERLRWFQSIAKERTKEAFLIYAGEYEQQVQFAHVLNYKHLSRILEP